jgi:hypothetical protein
MEGRRLPKEGKRGREADGVAGTGDILIAPHFTYISLKKSRFELHLIVLSLNSKFEISMFIAYLTAPLLHS